MDDTLNNFTETLQNTKFIYNDSYDLTPENFSEYLYKIQNNIADTGDLLCNEYSYFRYKIHEQCHQLAQAKTDAVKFMQWLKDDGWRVVICTYRDLRRANDYTKKWLQDNQIPFDYLFTAQNKIVLCALWKIEHLIDDDNFNIEYGAKYGVKVYYPVMAKHQEIQNTNAKGFHSFDEVRQWIQK